MIIVLFVGGVGSITVAFTFYCAPKNPRMVGRLVIDVSEFLEGFLKNAMMNLVMIYRGVVNGKC